MSDNFWWFSTPLPSTMSDNFYPVTSNFGGSFWTPYLSTTLPTLKSDVINGRSLCISNMYSLSCNKKGGIWKKRAYFFDFQQNFPRKESVCGKNNFERSLLLALFAFRDGNLKAPFWISFPRPNSISFLFDVVGLLKKYIWYKNF